MSNAPKRPAVDYIDTEDGAFAVYDERLTSEYMDHLEQRVRELEAQRDEAVRLLRGIMTGAIGRIKTYDEEEFAYKDEVTTFLAHIDKGTE